MSARLVVFAAASCFVACAPAPLPPEGQIVLHVDTDAPAPAGPDEPADPSRPPALVDRVRFDVLRGGALVAGASREFAVDAALLSAGKVSIGVLSPRGATDIVVRARMFRADRALGAEPPAGVTLDAYVALPAVSGDGERHVSVVLGADDFGRSIGRDAPIAPVEGAPGASRVGTWAKARRAGCAAPAAEGESCVGGGAFFFGDPALRGRTPSNDIADERVVVISAFYMDRTEVTVEAFRRAWPALAAAGEQPPVSWTGKDLGTRDDYCTWSPQPGALRPRDALSLDALPLNCVSWSTARAYCRASGKDLPTEAELEFAASGRGAESSYPWGEEEPSCEDAVWGRGGEGVFVSLPSDCYRGGRPSGVDLPGSGRRDRVLGVDGREIVDLAGNLSEWARDRWSAPNGYWAATTVMVDPVVVDASGSDGASPMRGGSWLLSPVGSRAGFRLRNAIADTPRATGFRCARAAEGRM